MNWRTFRVASLLLLMILAVFPGGVTAAPAVTVAPSAGPRGTQIGIVATGLESGTTYLVQLVRGIGNVNTERVFEDATESDASGDLEYDLIVSQEPGQYTVRIVAIGGTIVATAPYTVTAGREPETARYFPETGFNVRGRFLEYWRGHGLDLGDEAISERESLALFGYPLSDEFEQELEDGRTYRVQYFERVRMEYHPENPAPYDVLLGQFGRRVLAGVAGAPTARVPAEPGRLYFAETGHNVGPPFSTFWLRNGGLATFGYPLSEPFTQTLEDGSTLTVQYFERARFEEHTAREGMPYNIELGQFGRQILAEVLAGR